MSTLNEPICSRCSIALTYLLKSHFHKTKTVKRKAEEKRKQATDFKEAASCPSAVVQGKNGEKNDLCEGNTREKLNRR